MLTLLLALPVVMSYAPERRKGLYWAINSSLLSLGASIGALIPLAQNVRDAAATSVSTTTYLAFVIIIFVGVALTLLILRPAQVIRDDGTPVELTRSQGWKDELKGMAGLVKDTKLLWLLPLFWANNWFCESLLASLAGSPQGCTRPRMDDACECKL